MPDPVQASLETLRRRHDILSRQLDNLDRGDPERPPDVVASERALLAEALAALRGQLEEAEAAEPEGTIEAPREGPAKPARSTSRQPWFWAGATLAGLAGLAGLGLAVLARSAPLRVEPQGAPMAGHPASDVPAHSAAVDAGGPAESAPRAALDKNPDDVEARLELARLRLDKEDYMAVWAETQRVLKASPGNPRALTYQSQVRLAMGQPDVALELLKQALAKDPELMQAHIYQGYVYLRMGRDQDAAEVLAQAKRRFPTQAALLDRGFADMRAAVGKVEPFTPGAGPDPHSALGIQGQAAGHDTTLTLNPHANAQAPLAAPPATGGVVTGTLEMEPAAVARIPPGAVVFVTARQAGASAGPPVAAKRLTAVSFPLSFELSDADSMAGEPLPQRMSIEARVDGDGDPMTKDPGDAVARQDDVPAGTRGVRLVLAPKRR